MSTLTGLPLQLALDRLGARGIAPRVEFTAAPRRPLTQGEVRVLRYSEAEGLLLAAVFPQPIGVPAGPAE